MPHWRLEQDWQDWQTEYPVIPEVDVERAALYQQLVQRIWFKAEPVSRGSWLLLGAEADMTTRALGDQATWAFNNFSKDHT